MASKKTSVKKEQKRDATPIANFLNIGSVTYALGDLHKADFSSLEDPAASVKSIQAWAIALNNILRGTEES